MLWRNCDPIGFLQGNRKCVTSSNLSFVTWTKRSPTLANSCFAAFAATSGIKKENGWLFRAFDEW